MKKKKFLSAVLAASLLASTVPATAWASGANTEPVATEQASARSGELKIEGGTEGVDYRIDNGEITVINNSSLILTNPSAEYIINVSSNITVDITLKSSVTIELGQMEAGSVLQITSEDGTSSYCNFGDDDYQDFQGTVVLGTPDGTGIINVRNTKSTYKNGSLEINGGNVNIVVENSCRFENITVNDGNLKVSYGQNNQVYHAALVAKNLAIHGGKITLDYSYRDLTYGNGPSPLRGSNYYIDGGSICAYGETQVPDYIAQGYMSFYGILGGDVEFGVEDKNIFNGGNFQITGGEFYSGNIAENTVYGAKVADGYTIIVVEDQEDHFGYAKYKVVPEESIANLNVVGNGATTSEREITLNDGADITISSESQTNERIVVADGASATLTLNGVNIKNSRSPISLGNNSRLNLIIANGSKNSMETIGQLGFSAIEVCDRSKLVIKGSGDLYAKGSAGGAGIGTSEHNPNGGTITIENGVITAIGGDDGAGIGGGDSSNAADVEIAGGDIDARGQVGIGVATHSTNAYIEISGGNITANGNFGAGIGGGPGSELQWINISDGVINSFGNYGAGIGTGPGDSMYPYIHNSSIDYIDISGGEIIAGASSGGAGIGGGSTNNGSISSVGSIQIVAGTVKANGFNGIGAGKGGIGGGFYSYGDAVIIAGNIENLNDKENWKGVFFVGNVNKGNGVLYGEYIAPTEDFTVNNYLKVGENQTLVIREGIKLSNQGIIEVDPKGKLILEGDLEGNDIIYLSEDSPSPDETIVTGVQLSKEKMTLKPEASKRLTATVLPENAANKNVTWSSSDENVAKVNKNGRVTAVAEGTAVITVTTEEGNFKASCKVTVKANAPEEIDVESVSLDKTTLTLKPGTSDTLSATVAPEDATDKSLRWTSSNTNVATVDATGKVTAAGNGTAVITASTVDGGFTAQCTVTVSEDKPEIVAVENVTLDKTSASLEVGETEQLTATVKPADAANKSVRWKSNDENVVSVDANGKLTAISSGMATVTVTTEEGNFTALCKVTVTNPDDTTTDTETQPDGSTVTTVEDVNGSSSSTTVDKNGVSTTTVSLSETVIDQADRNDMAVILPMVGVTAATDIDAAPSVTVELPTSGATKVEIPVLDMTPGTVAVLVDARGNETVIKNSVIGNNGLIVTLADGDTVKILDNTQEYSDVAANHWAKDNVDYVTSRGLFVGVDDENFAPETSMTRAMIVSVLQRYAGDTTSASGDWYEGARQWAMENGISDGTNMNGNVTREQLVTMLYRYIGSPQIVGSLADYSDNASVSPYAEQAMVWAVKSGIIGGMTADTLAPQGLATRAQVAAILERFIAWEQA